MKTQRFHKKKNNSWKIVLLLIVLLAIGTGAYSYYQYKKGMAESLGKIESKENESYQFSGRKDQYGGTNILVLGSDLAENQQSRADTIMIVHYNQKRGTYKLTSIMRDSYVVIPGHGKHKINSAFALGGPELIRKTLKENFDIDLQYYVILDYQGFVNVIDEAFPNGIEINVEKKMVENIEHPLEPGIQRLDGAHLLSYVRFRHDAVGDFGRVERQQSVVKEVGRQLASFQTVPKLPKLIGVVRPYINTNMDASDIVFMAKDYFTGDKGELETLRIPVKDAYTDQRVSGEGQVLDLDLEKNKEVLHQFIEK